MKLLLDTHVFLWYISADDRLPSSWCDAIRNPANEVFLSAASIWEAVIKHALGKLPLPEDPAQYLPRQREEHHIATLPVDEASLSHLSELPSLHRDPFDRVLISQALQYHLTIITVDDAIRAYPVPILTMG